MSIYQDLLGMKFTRLDGVPVWHQDVKVYQVQDKASGNLLGHFYLDLHPRDNKYGHAAVFPIHPRALIDGKINTPVAAMVTNFDKPTADKPSLLQHVEVKTFFHEFGHVMHNMATQATIKRFSGTSTERDFVELPSQMLENWMWDKNVIGMVSKHYKTGEKLPESTLIQMEKVKMADRGMVALGHIHKGTFDLMLHSASDQKMLNRTSNATINLQSIRKSIKKNGTLVDSKDLWRSTKKSLTGITAQEGTDQVASFGHLWGGYSSQYYSYLWSLVYAADVFEEFKAKGLLNPEVGMKYRKLILAPGGT